MFLKVTNPLESRTGSAGFGGFHRTTTSYSSIISYLERSNLRSKDLFHWPSVGVMVRRRLFKSVSAPCSERPCGCPIWTAYSACPNVGWSSTDTTSTTPQRGAVVVCERPNCFQYSLQRARTPTANSFHKTWGVVFLCYTVFSIKIKCLGARI